MGGDDDGGDGGSDGSGGGKILQPSQTPTLSGRWVKNPVRQLPHFDSNR